LSTGLKANNDGSAAIQVGGTDYIEIGSTGNITMPGNLTVTGTFTAGGGLVYDLNRYVAPATWTKPTGLKAIKVTVVGAGGDGGVNPPGANAAAGGGSGGAAILVMPAPSIPGPVAITAGPGTNSFGAFCSATAGGAGGAGVNGTTTAGGTGGLGAGGSVNIDGNKGSWGVYSVTSPTIVQSGAGAPSILGTGGGSIWQLGPVVSTLPGTPGSGYGSGGGGGIRGPATATITSTGAPGIVIVEEFY
jgi:hypothetical protein